MSLGSLQSNFCGGGAGGEKGLILKYNTFMTQICTASTIDLKYWNKLDLHSCCMWPLGIISSADFVEGFQVIKLVTLSFLQT